MADKTTLASLVRRTAGYDTLDVLLSGVEGIGKTTFAASAPAPIVTGNENGLPRELRHIPHLPAPAAWEEYLGQIRLLRQETHEFKTLVVDTLDWLEPLVWDHVCREDKAKRIEDVGGGYGKGYIAAVDEWRRFLRELESLRPRMNIVMLAHVMVKPFRNPHGTDYDRYVLKLNEKSAAVIKEWTNCVLFAQYEDFVDTGANRKARVGKGVGGSRVVFTQRRPAYDAKDRYGLPARLPLDWSAFYSAARPTVEEQAARASALCESIRELAAKIGNPKTSEWVEKKLVEVGVNVSRLSTIENTLAEKVAEITASNDTSTTESKEQAT